MGRFAAAGLGLTVALLGGACGPADGDEGSAEWELERAESTRTLQIAVPAADAPSRRPLTLLVDLVVSGSDDPALQLDQVYSLAVSEDGTLFALDRAARQVKSFAANGTYLGSWGGPGREAAQFFGPSEVTAAGAEIVVVDPAVGKLSRWSVTGEHVADVSDPVLMDINAVAGIASGDILVSYVLEQQRDELQSLSLLSPGAEELRRYTLLPADKQDVAMAWPRASFAASSEGRLYVTTGAEYQVHAFEASGVQSWALRADWPRTPVTAAAVGRSVRRTRRAGRAMSTNVDSTDTSALPAAFPALAGLEVDGRGNLYVFPYVDDGSPQAGYPVDVYTPEGELLFAATLPFQGWNAQLGELIYRVEDDADTEAVRLVRYRLGPPRN